PPPSSRPRPPHHRSPPWRRPPIGEPVRERARVGSATKTSYPGGGRGHRIARPSWSDGAGRVSAHTRTSEGVSMKRIGVLGGISPQATMDFEARVHRLCQRLVPQQWNMAYPPMVVWYHRRLPVRVD